MNRKKEIKDKAIFFAIILMLFSGTVFAYVSSSTNYILQFDSINLGGDLSTSTNYTMQDTMGEIGTGNSTGTAYIMHAGYQNLNEQYIAVSAGTDVNLGILTTSTNTTLSATKNITVNTDNPAGYLMYLSAPSSPVLNCSSGSCTPGVDFFADYTAGGLVPDFSWSISASDAEFGYTVEGNDTASFFRDDGGTCGTGNGNVADKCWWPITTTNRLIAQSSLPNHTSGTQTTIKFYGQIGASKTLTNGVYTSNITVSVVPQ